MAEITRRTVLLACAAAAVLPQAIGANANVDELSTMDATGLAELVRKGKVSWVDNRSAVAKKADKDLILQDIAEQFHDIDKSLGKIAVGLFALKAIVALQMNPSAPSQALKMIQEFEDEIAKLDQTRPMRERTDEVFGILRLIQKHGGAKRA
jgi:hypothetical protein